MTERGSSGSARRARPSARLVAGLVGAAAGFGMGSAVYLLVNPVLENSQSWIEELQGLLWNVVPFLTAGGFALGWWVARHRQADGAGNPPITR
ncbi:MAG TPA: hypothetical protein VML96_04515 [Egibacteraceae bacterium]|nr:hypothetical protein [Egibacteraceae bacterium]